MAQCPAGHDSATDDFCDVCGMRIPTSPPPRPAAPAGSGPAAANGAGEPCPRCGTPRTGQFCEACGLNFHAAQQAPLRSSASAAPAPPPAPPPAPHAPYATPASQAPSAPYPPPGPAPSHPYPPAAWTAVVSADRGYYEQVQAATGPDGTDIAFPAYCPERRFQLSGTQMRIGRRSKARGLEPEIDLTGPPTDPGVSRLHAVLLAAPDG
jgi:hypothetical protein